jgi:hypothetical protein
MQNKSRARRLQYDWLRARAGEVDGNRRVLDLGGVDSAEYHGILGLPRERLVLWNFDPKTLPDAVVDLDDVAGLPEFPRECSTVLAMNLLEHLYRPFELLTWVCCNLPAGGKLFAAVPFAYPIHPSPNDFWRITPQAFERFFEELAEKGGIRGQLTLQPLGEDFREGTSLLTSTLFKSGKLERALATGIESAAFVASLVAAPLIGRAKVRAWAERNAPAIGVSWEKR